MADVDLDAILYPLQKILVAPVTAEDQVERNGTLSNGTGFPGHLPGRFLRTDLVGAARPAGRCRAAGPRLHRAEAPRLRLRIRAGDPASKAAEKHAAAAGRAVAARAGR